MSGQPRVTEARGRFGRRRRVIAVAAALVAIGVAALWWAGALTPDTPSGNPSTGAPPPATAAVTRQDIVATTPMTATLGYSGSYPVRGQGGGTLTWLPAAGAVIRPGQALYKIDNGSPVVLLDGSVPAWRSLREGLAGPDVAQLNHNLVALGDAPGSGIAAAGWARYSPSTAAGVRKLRSTLGVSSPSDSLSLGSVVFEPQALRIADVIGSLGGPADGPVLVATSDQHVVTIPLDVSQQGAVKPGDAVTVTLPDGTTTPGTVSSVGTVATASAANGDSTTTIPVLVTLTDPQAGGTLDRAPVTVNVTTATVPGALVVPVTALVAQSTGTYAVEVIGPADTRRWVPVTPGIFDDSSGLVQVTGALAPGQRVVVALS